MNEGPFLPIKIVVPQADHIRKPEMGGSEPTVFGDVDEAVRLNLSEQVKSVISYFGASFERFPEVPAVARVILKEDALAKSHRPTEIFQAETCPIIGTDVIGDLFVTVTRNGLERLRENIETRSTKRSIANISTIAAIRPYTVDDVFTHDVGPGELYAAAAEEPIKLRLFNHHNDAYDAEIIRALTELSENIFRTEPEPIYYAPTLRIFKLRLSRPEDVTQLANFVGTQSLSPFTKFGAIEVQAHTVRQLRAEDFPPPLTDVDYPIVGVIDSGTSSAVTPLAPWVVDRRSFVAPQSLDPSHGTFVSGLIVHSRALNHSDTRLPAEACKIVDIAAVPRIGAEHLSEDELLQTIETSFMISPDVRVWNLSIGTNRKCHAQRFSDFAIALDDLQRRYGKVVVLAAGNHRAPLLRPWPPAGYTGDDLCVPTDSLKAVVVGALAHHALSNSGVKAEEPAPYSRSGPGPVFMPKPDLTHYGGNCTLDGDSAQVGMLSLGLANDLAEACGTSYAAPLISNVLANLDFSLATRPSDNLLKALVIHSAALRAESIDADHLKYRGFGIPGSLSDIIRCKESNITFVFEPQLVAGYQYEIRNFPMPACLIGDDGAVRARITLTLVYDPPLDGSAGAEYARTNVDVSLGTYAQDKNGKWIQTIQVPPEPGDASSKYERDLLEHGFKWSPIKVYKRIMQRAGAGKEWRLMMRCYHRSGFDGPQPQPVAVVITIEDPDGKLPVYNDGVVAARAASLIMQDLTIKHQLRLQF